MASIFSTVRSAFTRASERNAPLLAAGVAFYMFLSIFPAMIAAVLSYGLFASPQTVAEQSEQIASTLPSDAASIITGQMESLTSSDSGSLGIGLIIATVLGLYSASAGVSNLLKALRAMFDHSKQPGFLRAKIESIVLTAGAIIFGLVLVTLVAAAPAIFDALELPRIARVAVEAGRWLVIAAALIFAISVLFRVAQSTAPKLRGKSRFGAMLAALLWLAVSLGFSLYVDQFGSYGKTYGALAGVVALLMWLWVGLFALLLGASAEAELESQAVPAHAIDPDRNQRAAAHPRSTVAVAVADNSANDDHGQSKESYEIQCKPSSQATTPQAR